MGVYSIKDLEILSGIKAHTLRIWEQRYGIITPQRTDTNIRYYNDADLKRILNIALLNQNGVKISKIASLSDKEIYEEVLKVNQGDVQYPEHVNNMVKCMLNFDKELFEKVFSRSVLQFGFENTMLHIIFPFLNKVGMLWLTGSVSPSQEHFISHLIREKMMVALDGQIESTSIHSKKFLLYLPEGEYHEIALLFASYIIRAQQNQVLYLGQSLPFEHVTEAYQHYKPDYVLINLTVTPAGYEIGTYIHEAAKHYSQATVLLAGFQFDNQTYTLPPNTRLITSMHELRSL